MGYDIKTEGSGVYGFWFWNGELGFRRFLSDCGVAFGTVEKIVGAAVCISGSGIWLFGTGFGVLVPKLVLLLLF